MQLKKKLVALALAASMMISVSAPALATSKFNMGVFEGRQDAFILSDEMTGEAIVLLEDDSTARTIYFDDGSRIVVTPGLMLNDSYDYYVLTFGYFGANLAGIDNIIIKIGDNRYSFSNCPVSRSKLGDDLIYEEMPIRMKRETVSFMNDLSDHREEEIKVRVNGVYQTFDFTLPDAAKDRILCLYDLYSQGGGTRDSNLRSITDTDQVIVEKNGKLIDGHKKEKIIDALLSAF